ncbi:Splicing factor, Prp19-binding domain family protein [Candida parapsilosis]|uniref:MFAP1 domain-containing protein n=2 Tax=Candida parapsilosis TaxID=5480 RepID=G8BF32_CANPC|nr:uncharacterized protein CPAR2_201330 [Candida parapsilosis]KAF6055358.1 Splicing factor, Prp19-binding domain family protein [Candida parapsilosis]KAF6055619.1 Splicing factor, Prp19-binding domain family protein [Candida parapsilosis]KAF6058549.1 Splicing factor, Prp19-binding domain family protein [Candida parapsilosis]KAF6067306.1 Splicing factor, Prp19-binding domain family protein [Candida parapsilosis]CAD1808028.1 unnamed protein product [Candida parapsilosis]
MSESSSESSSSSSSSEDEIAKPVYIKKQKGESGSESENTSRQVLLSQLESKEIKETTEDEYDVDDTDDLDPQLEYDNWKQREKQRFLRDQQILREAEMEKKSKEKKSEKPFPTKCH